MWQAWRSLGAASLRSRGLPAFALGAVSATAFAPWRLWLLAPLCLIALHCCGTLRGSSGFDRPGSRAVRRELIAGLCFGMGQILCGASWLYLGIYQGGHNVFYALLFSAMLMLIHALHFAAVFGLSCWLALRCPTHRFACYSLLFFPACWVLMEWLRRALTYDLPWFVLGESQVPGGLLSGFAPVGGVLLVSYLLVASAGAVAILLQRRSRISLACLGLLLACFVGDAMLRQCAWSESVGKPVSVVLVQTMRPVGQKWTGNAALATGKQLESLVEQAPDAIIVTPETMLETPAFLMPNAFWNRLHSVLEKNRAVLLLGIPTAEHTGSELRIYNSVLSLGASGFDLYRKQHLVPVAEHLPFKESLGALYRAALSYPLQDQSFGEAEWSHPLYASGYLFAPLICYDASYGESAARQAVSANAIVDLSDDSWIDSEAYFSQTEQMAQARALEAARPLLRTNNVGHTAVIGVHGEILAAPPPRQDALLRFSLVAREGSTPYMRFGDLPVCLMACLALLAGLACGTSVWRRRSPAVPATS